MPRLLAYLVVFLFLKLAGWQTCMRQLSLFERLIILPLVSAAGDMTVYEGVPLLGVVLTMGIFYPASTALMATSRVPA